MLPPRHRLRTPDEFRAVLRARRGSGGRRCADSLIVMHARLDAADPTRSPRVGFAVSKAVGNSVVRHRVVRRLRAQLAQRLPLLPSGLDLVVRAQPASAAADSAQLGASVQRCLSSVLR